MAVREEIYRGGAGTSQVAPLPGVSADEFGASIGRGMEQLGNTLHQVRVQAAAREHQNVQSAEHARVAVAFSERGLDLSRQARALRETAAEDFPGYIEKVNKLYAEGGNDLLNSITDPKVREQWAPQVASMRARAVDSADEFVAIARPKAKHQDTQVAGANYDVAQDHEPDRDMLAQSIEAGGVMIDGVTHDPTLREALKTEWNASRVIGYYTGRSRHDAVGALAELDRNDNTTYLDGKQLAALRSDVESAARQEVHATEAVMHAKLADYKGETQTIIADVSDGKDVNAKDLLMRAAALKADDPELARSAEEAAYRANVNHEYGTSTLDRRTAAMRDIEGQKDWRSDLQKVIMHDQLEALNKRDGDKMKGDPLSLFIEQGGASNLPAFNITDPATTRRWIVAGNAMAKAYHRDPVYMTEDVAAAARQDFNAKGPADKAALIQAFGQYSRQDAGVLLRQLAPGKPMFGTMLDLATMRDRGVGMQLVREAIEGFDQTQANPKLIDDNAMQLQINQFAKPLAMLPGSSRQGVLDVAKGLYGQRAARAGATVFQPSLYRDALADALGRSGETGGFGKADNGQPMVLPRGMTSRDVSITLARSVPTDFVTASGGDVPKAGGKDVTVADFRRSTPVLMSDAGNAALYAFRTESGFLQSLKHRGQPYVVDMRLLAHMLGSKR